MKITIVMENSIPISTPLPFLAEHGLAMLLESKDRKFLIDSGQSAALIHNLSLLGVPLTDIHGIIVSHGHYDHTGGLQALLTHRGQPIPVYAIPGIFAARFSASQGKYRPIGIPQTKEFLIGLGADFQYVSAPYQLTEELWLSGPIPRQTSFEEGDSHLRVKEMNSNDSQMDPILDDLSLYHVGENGLTVITGCAHAGIINVIRHGFAVTGAQKLHGVIGGTHLGPVSREQQEQSLAELARLHPNFIAANHCTGFAMQARLVSLFGDVFRSAPVGSIFEV